MHNILKRRLVSHYIHRQFVAYKLAYLFKTPEKMQEPLGADMRNFKGQVLTSGASSRQPVRKLFLDTTLSDSKSTEASTSLSLDELGNIDSPCGPSTSRAIEVTEIKTSAASHSQQCMNKVHTIGSKTKSCILDGPCKVEMLHHKLVGFIIPVG